MSDETSAEFRRRGQLRSRAQTRIELWNFIVALDELIGDTGAENQPPRFAEAVAAREAWTDSEVRKLRNALSKALRFWIMPWTLEWCLCLGEDMNKQVRSEAEGPLHLSLTTLRDLQSRWRVAGEVPGGPKVDIPAPIIEPAEHESLTWCVRRLLRLHDWLNWHCRDQATDGPADRPSPFRVVGGETDAAPRASLVLVGPDNPPIIRGKAWERTLNEKQYRVLKVLVDKFPVRVSLDKLKECSKVGDARGILLRLRGKPPWDAVIDMAVEPGGKGQGKGYGIKSN